MSLPDDIVNRGLAAAAAHVGPNGNGRRAALIPPGADDFANYKVVGDAKVGLGAQALTAALAERTGGWPKRMGARLFVKGTDGKPLWLEDSDGVFAWIGRQYAGESSRVRWATGEDKLTRGQFVAALEQTAEAYEAVEVVPHEPKLPALYYMHPGLPRPTGTALPQLLARFQPASDVDADLLKALFLTLFWGGSPGQRPAFLIESEDDDRMGGRGVGKSKLAHAVARLAGGHIDARPTETIDQLVTRLLSPGGLDRRVLLLDNVKTLRFSWGDLEALVTTDTISGRSLYLGEGRRPNLLLWLITLNGAVLSRDMAQRCVSVVLRRPSRDPTWEAATWALLDRRRWDIVADALAELRKPAQPLGTYSRWSAWEDGVLARTSDPKAAQALIVKRQEAMDDDRAEADLVRDGFVQELQRRGHAPDLEVVWVPAQVAAEIVQRATGEKYPVNRASAFLKTLGIAELRKSDQGGRGRGWVWRGQDADPEADALALGERPAELPW